MAFDRHLFPAAKNLQPNLVEVAGRVAIGSTGAVGTITGKGFTVARTGAGLYTITLTAKASIVPDIIHAAVDVGFATGSTTFQAKVLTIVPGTCVITVQTSALSAPNTAADPTSGAFLLLKVLVQNSFATQ